VTAGNAACHTVSQAIAITVKPRPSKPFIPVSVPNSVQQCGEEISGSKKAWLLRRWAANLPTRQ
jgi:hypothetical protein